MAADAVAPPARQADQRCDEEESCLSLPSAFVEFLAENNLDESIYSLANSIPRYIRLKPNCESDIADIESELGCRLEKVSWLPGFFSIQPQIQIARSRAYQIGKLYGIDAASGAAVLALNVSPGDHVLDLCAAPGAKLCMISDILGNSGSLTGVDISRQRLAACRTMLRKYSLGSHCRLFVADGASFSILPGRPSIQKNCSVHGHDCPNKFLPWTSKRTWKDRKLAQKAKNASRSVCNLSISEPELIYYGEESGMIGLCKEMICRQITADDQVLGYDKVLVDAECTHDGSVKHIQKFEFWGWKTLERRLLDADRTNNLTDLQLQLLTNGFKLLKVGGLLVYSTCSLTVAQNEDVVEQFLSRNHAAELLPVEAASNWPCQCGKTPKTLRFDPATSKTSGLFIAKITRLSQDFTS